jgi:hypothetical protein
LGLTGISITLYSNSLNYYLYKKLNTYFFFFFNQKLLYILTVILRFTLFLKKKIKKKLIFVSEAIISVKAKTKKPKGNLFMFIKKAIFFSKLIKKSIYTLVLCHNYLSFSPFVCDLCACIFCFFSGGVSDPFIIIIHPINTEFFFCPSKYRFFIFYF